MALDKTKLHIQQVSGGLSNGNSAIYTIKYDGAADDWVVTNSTEGDALLAVLSIFGIKSHDILNINFATVGGGQKSPIVATLDSGSPGYHLEVCNTTALAVAI